VYNFQSEKVPAHHSQNCIFELTSNSQVYINLSTSFIRLSTSFPLSIIIGFNPAFARASQQKIPAGQNPIISGLCSGFLEHFLITYENSSTNFALCFLNFSKSIFGFFSSKSTE
jgi:hypothetical protein